MFLFSCYVNVSDRVKCFTKMKDANFKSNVNVYILDSIKKDTNTIVIISQYYTTL